MKLHGLIPRHYIMKHGWFVQGNGDGLSQGLVKGLRTVDCVLMYRRYQLNHGNELGTHHGDLPQQDQLRYTVSAHPHNGILIKFSAELFGLS